MEQFLTLNDLPSLSEAVNEAIELKKNPFAFKCFPYFSFNFKISNNFISSVFAV